MDTAINPKNPLITLEFVKSKFDHWRTTRKHRSKIPDELWEYAKLLYPQYRITELCNTLKLSYKDFKLKLMSSDSAQTESASFTQCVLPMSFNEDKKDGTLEFIRRDGSILKLNGFSVQNILPIVSLLIRER
jgi:hypothetical protein